MVNRVTGSTYYPTTTTGNNNYRTNGSGSNSFTTNRTVPCDYTGNYPYSDAPTYYGNPRQNGNGGGGVPKYPATASPQQIQIYYNINTTNNILVNNQFPVSSTGAQTQIPTGNNPLSGSNGTLTGNGNNPLSGGNGLQGNGNLQAPMGGGGTLGGNGTNNGLNSPLSGNALSGNNFGGAGTLQSPFGSLGGGGTTTLGGNGTTLGGNGTTLGGNSFGTGGQNAMNFISGGVTGNTGSVNPFTAVSQAQQIAMGGGSPTGNGTLSGMPTMNASPLGSGGMPVTGSAGLPSGSGGQMGQLMQMLLVGLLSILSSLGGEGSGSSGSGSRGDITSEFISGSMGEDLSRI